ncbi:sensor histidine kinase [Saccharothrix variisporea]|nr:ATP-binding protein [Saccharothrix variisporea]
MLRGRMTVGLRFTVLYAVVFLVSGAALAALINLFGGDLTSVAPVGGPPPDPGWEQARSRQLLVGTLAALAVMAAVSVLVGKAIAGRVLRPLRTITAATRRITAENLHERLAVTGPADEVKQLADTVDDLLERLETSFSAQRAFVANASHELRTPLATMRASLDVATAKPHAHPQTVALADRLRAQLTNVDHLLDALLTLARAGTPTDLAPVSLSALADQALLARAEILGVRKISVDRNFQNGEIFGSPVLLAQLVDNVVDNAVRHNVDGGWMKVTAGDSLVVESGGPVLAQADVERLGRPFQRLTNRTGSDRGSGLGLSIVAAIATAHDGCLSITARPEGGLRVTVHFGAKR